MVKKKMRKTMMAISAAMTMAVSMTACSGGEEQITGSKDGTEAQENEYTEIVYAFKTFNNVPEDVSDVENAINEITRDKIGVEVKLMPLASSTYGQQVSLAMQGGEQIDLFHSGGGLEFAGCLSNHQAYDITDIVKDHAAGAMDAVGEEFMKTSSMDGKIYGIPAHKGVAKAPTLLYRADILKEIGVEPDSIKSIQDLTDVFAKVKEAYPDMAPLIPVNPGDSGMVNTIYGFDYLGDRYLNPTGVLRGDSTTVENFYETEEFAEILKLARSWYTAGYIMGDAATTTSTSTELLSADKGFCYISNYAGSDAAVQISVQTGKEIGGIRICEPYLATTEANSVTWMVASTSKNPEKALDFLNLTYTDPDVINLIIYGIEGRDYVKVSDKTVTWPDGLDANSVPYTAQLSCGICGSQFNQYVLDGADLSTFEVMKDDNQNCGKSKAFGFMFDSSGVKTQYTAVANVINQYLPGLRCGSLDPETELPKFQKQLKEAGIDEIIQAKQEQLDQWLSGN